MGSPKKSKNTQAAMQQSKKGHAQMGVGESNAAMSALRSFVSRCEGFSESAIAPRRLQVTEVYSRLVTIIPYTGIKLATRAA